MKETRAGLVPASAPGFGVTWGGPPRAASRALTVAAAAAMIAGMAGPAVASTASGAPPVSVIVQELPGSGDVPENAVAALGGTVVRSLDVIDGFEARLPADRLAVLRGVAGVRDVTENAAVTLQSTDVAEAGALPGSLNKITREVIGAKQYWEKGFTGKGVDVAVIDSGVAPVEGLRTAGKVVHGPDLSFESQWCDANQECKSSPLRNMDTYGHGTHIAGIIAGKDSTVGSPLTAGDGDFVGVAPDARILSIKVADAQGATDVSQVIAAIDWVIQHKQSFGLNIRVLNMSFGTDGVQSYQLDPLSYAAEQAWHAGIAVVVAGGNNGYGSAKLNNPAYNPYVIAVGGSDSKGTAAVGDDVVPAWSATGDGARNPDVVAPGQSVVGLRVPGSYLDNAHPGGRQGERLFRGSGTSQSAAVVSGAAALIISQRPSIKPDQLKALLMGTARDLPAADPIAQGDGLVNLAQVRDTATPQAAQAFPRSTGLGSLEAARGGKNLDFGGIRLEGEVDVLGRPWVAATATLATATRTAWVGGTINGNGWAGGSWLGQKWYPDRVSGTVPTSLSGLTWSGLTWSGLTWSGLTWSGLTWSGLTWSGLTWSGLTWSGLTWSGLTWSGLTWSGLTWSGLTWSGLTWSGGGWS
jgi:serine protease AprX